MKYKCCICVAFGVAFGVAFVLLEHLKIYCQGGI